MDQTNHASDDHSESKLVAVVASYGNHGLESSTCASDHMHDSPGGNLLKHRQTGIERTPLIRPRLPDEVTEDSQDNSSSCGSVQMPTYGAIAAGRPAIVIEPNIRWKFKKCFRSLEKTLSQPRNSILMLMLIVIVNIVLVLTANINTDHKGIQVKPQDVLVYLMLLICIFVVWNCFAIIPQKVQYSSRHDRTIIPSHLLTGIGIFGTVSAATQILLLLDFLKCSQNVNGLSYIYAVYPFFKIVFIYFQMYFFYMLSRNGVRHSNLPAGVFFVMVTLATNLCIWVSVFFTDATSNPKLKDVTWLNHYYFGVLQDNPCANKSLTSPAARQLHALVQEMSPYISAFSMEYALLAAGLLLHIWKALKQPIPKVPKPRKQQWTPWRFGFIVGLLSIPGIFLAYVKEQTTLELSAPKVMLYVLKAGFFFVLMIFCLYSAHHINEQSGFVKKEKPMKLEVVLLGISGFLGFPAFNLACTFAAICELKNDNVPTLEALWYGICSLFEMFACFVQFYSIKKAYQYKLPDVTSNKVAKTARFVRQYASFALVVNIAYWASKTYDLRHRSSSPSIAERYFGKYTWFALSHFSIPLCIFFYFHLAICYANVVSTASQFGPLGEKNAPDNHNQ